MWLQGTTIIQLKNATERRFSDCEERCENSKTFALHRQVETCRSTWKCPKRCCFDCEFYRKKYLNTQLRRRLCHQSNDLCAIESKWKQSLFTVCSITKSNDPWIEGCRFEQGMSQNEFCASSKEEKPELVRRKMKHDKKKWSQMKRALY